MPAKEYPHKRPRTESTTSKAKKFTNASEICFALRTDNQEGLIEGAPSFSSYRRVSNVMFSSHNAPKPVIRENT